MTAQNINNVADFTADQLAVINAYLSENNVKPFDVALLGLFQSPLVVEHLDLIRFVNGRLLNESQLECIGVRFLNKHGENYDDLLDAYKTSLNKADYSEEDYQQLITDQRNEYKNQVVYHGLCLTSTTGAKADVLLLNKEYLPLAIQTISF